jgi:hypothetical protein
LLPILLLTAWIFLFSLILILGAEVVALGALRRAQQENQSIGPALDGTVPPTRGAVGARHRGRAGDRTAPGGADLNSRGNGPSATKGRPRIRVWSRSIPDRSLIAGCPRTALSVDGSDGAIRRPIRLT